jgi:hypothetical protein
MNKTILLLSSVSLFSLAFSACSKEPVQPAVKTSDIQAAPYKVVFVSGKEVATSRLYLDGRSIQYLTAREAGTKPLEETTRSLQTQTYMVRMFDAGGKEELAGRLHFNGHQLEKDMDLGDVRIERDDLDRLYTVWIDM